jgi:transposase
MLTVPPTVKLWYCPDAVDMRLGFDGLFTLVQNRLKADPLSGHLFIFRNRSADRLKILYWGGHGLCLWCQRLEAGRYHFPHAPAGANVVELSACQLQMVLDGIDLSTADYTADGPQHFLQGYRGFLQADALAQYEGLYSDDRGSDTCAAGRTPAVSSWPPLTPRTSGPRRPWC